MHVWGESHGLIDAAVLALARDAIAHFTERPQLPIDHTGQSTAGGGTSAVEDAEASVPVGTPLVRGRRAASRDPPLLLSAIPLVLEFEEVVVPDSQPEESRFIK